MNNLQKLTLKSDLAMTKDAKDSLAYTNAELTRARAALEGIKGKLHAADERAALAADVRHWESVVEGAKRHRRLLDTDDAVISYREL
jgi:hypothetical protein